jgi:hypothetical protein
MKAQQTDFNLWKEGGRVSLGGRGRERDFKYRQCNVLLCFITNYTCESLVFRSKKPVLNCSRFTDVSTPKLSENKHSAKNEA